MKQIKTKEVDLRTNKYKILIGHNDQAKEKFLRQLQASFQKKNSSDYQEENSLFEYVKINERDVNQKENVFYLLHPWLDIDEELKLGSKSLFLRHIEALLQEIEFDDHFNMLKQVIGLFESETLNTKHNVTFDDISLRYQISEFNSKLFSKLIEVGVYKEDLKSVALDLTYDETIKLISNVINEIAKIFFHLTYWILISKKHVSSDLIRYFETTEQNLYIILDCESIDKVYLDQIVYFGDRVTDFQDPEQCYELMVEMNQEFDTLENFKITAQQHIDKYLNSRKIFQQI
ncbi:MAG: hypothetical protein KGZ38_07410 [Erysipelothrix sp.]|nr:hypothetical protein [Erysipelothrix sp.]